VANLRPVRPEPPEQSPPSYGSWFHWLLPHRPHLGQSLPALASRDFRIFWLGQLVSLTGTWIQSVAQQWLVLQLTHSAFKLGLVTAIQFTPLLVLALIGGAIADRVDKRKLLVITQVVSMLLALGLGTLVKTGAVQYWHVLVFAGLLGIVNAFYTPARQAFVPELVDRDILMNAVALNSAIFNGARVVGPAIGGLLIATVGLSLNFYLNSLSYVAVIIGLLVLHTRPAVTERPRESLLSNVREGLSYVRATPVVYTILALIGVTSLFALNFTTLVPVFAQKVLHVGSSGFGFLLASMGVGSLAGSITIAFLNRRDLARRFIYLGATAFCIAEILFALSHVYALCVALLMVVGVSQTLFTTTANTRILSLTPSHLQGRVMSLYSLMFLGMTPFGSFLSGVVAERYGAPSAFISGAAITLVFTGVVFALHPSQRTAKRVEERAQSES